MNWKNRLTELLHIDYPIVQAPMLGVSTPEMAAAIANAGGLGSLPVGGLAPDKTAELIRRTKALTGKPFAVNLFTYPIPQPVPEQVTAMKAFLLQLCARHGLPFEEQDFGAFHFHSYKEQIEVLVQEKVSIVSFTFGIPDDEDLQRMRSNGMVLIGTATCVREAVLLEEKRVDAISAQGIEAGGHRGSFLEEEPLPHVGLLPLLTGIIEKVKVPVIAAGGICDGKSIAAALALGAAGVQPGTAFIAADESSAIPAYKERLRTAIDTESSLTRAFSGRWARGLRNSFMDAVEAAGITIPAYPIQNILTTNIRQLAQRLNNSELTNLWAGQCAYKAEAKPAATIFRELVLQAETAMM